MTFEEKSKRFDEKTEKEKNNGIFLYVIRKVFLKKKQEEHKREFDDFLMQSLYPKARPKR